MIKKLKFIISAIIFAAGCNNLYHGINSIPLIPFGIPIDNLAIEYQYPTPGASGVTCNKMILVAFNKPLDSASIKNDTLKVTSGGVGVDGITNLTESKFLIFTPSSPPFSEKTIFTVTLKNTIYDKSRTTSIPNGFSWSFTTGAATDIDNISPYIESRYPESLGDLYNDTTTDITIKFSEDIDPGTVNNSNIILTSSSGTSIDYTVIYNAATQTISCNPMNGSITGTNLYTVTVSGIKDLAGNTMIPSPDSWNFCANALISGWPEPARNQDGLGFGTFGDIDGEGVGLKQGFELVDHGNHSLYERYPDDRRMDNSFTIDFTMFINSVRADII